MIECRPPRTEELDAMLGLLCDAFGLPFGPARDLFYKDPYFDVERKRVLVADAEVVSCLTIVEADIRIGAAIIHVGGIAGVATKTEHRGKGYASSLLMDCIPVLRGHGCALAALFPYSLPFYRRLGWETAGTQFEAVVPSTSLPRFAESRYVRHCLPGDRADVARLYDDWTRNQTGAWLRDQRRWDYLAQHVKSIVVYKRSSLDGYTFYETRMDPDSPARLRILEMVAATEEARRGLTGFLAERENVGEVTWTARLEEIAESGILSGADGGPERSCPCMCAQVGAMFRVTDFPGALRALAPNLHGFRGDVVLHCTDEHAPRGAEPSATLTGDGKSITVQPGAAARNARHRIEGDVRAWTQVLTGYRSLDDSLSLNQLRSMSPQASAALGPFFPRRELFIPPADHF